MHPAAVAVPDAHSFDHLYESADTFDQVYGQIVEDLVAAATAHGRVLYAVPGSPDVLERAVARLRTDDRVALEICPAMSFLELAWTRLGIDPVEARVRLVDGHTFATSAAGESGPLLVAHCHNQRVLSDIKLAVDEPGDTPVTVLQRLGLPDEHIVTVPWSELDREVEADHLTSIYIPKLTNPVGVDLLRFYEMVTTLRVECPWDREQTHQSLRRHLIEEAYEVLDAIDGFDPETGEGAEHLEEELGDLLFQVFIHSVIAAEEGWFDISDVSRSVYEKLHGRHPHVYGDASVSSVDELLGTWETQKREEKGRASVMEGIPSQLPGLARAEKVIKKSAAVSIDLDGTATEDLVALAEAAVGHATDTSLGAVLFGFVAVARGAGVDPEMALREHTSALMARVGRYEQLAEIEGIDVASANVADVSRLWQAARENS